MSRPATIDELATVFAAVILALLAIITLSMVLMLTVLALAILVTTGIQRRFLRWLRYFLPRHK